MKKYKNKYGKIFRDKKVKVIIESTLELPITEIELEKTKDYSSIPKAIETLIEALKVMQKDIMLKEHGGSVIFNSKETKGEVAIRLDHMYKMKNGNLVLKQPTKIKDWGKTLWGVSKWTTTKQHI